MLLAGLGQKGRGQTSITLRKLFQALPWLLMMDQVGKSTGAGGADVATSSGALCAATETPAETQELAAVLARQVRDGDLIVLAGDLGAGKTCFSQGFGAGLGIEERITSPTFTLHNQYQGRLLFNHLDVYRLDDLAETLDLDLPEMLESGVTLIEWGEQIDPTLPSDHLVIRILMVEGGGDDSRLIQLEAGGPEWTSRLNELAGALGSRVNQC